MRSGLALRARQRGQRCGGEGAAGCFKLESFAYCLGLEVQFTACSTGFNEQPVGHIGL
jgi:hypothetical protein